MDADDEIALLLKTVEGRAHLASADFGRPFDPSAWTPHEIKRGPRKGQMVFRSRGGAYRDSLPESHEVVDGKIVPRTQPQDAIPQTDLPKGITAAHDHVVRTNLATKKFLELPAVIKNARESLKNLSAQGKGFGPDAASMLHLIKRAQEEMVRRLDAAPSTPPTGKDLHDAIEHHLSGGYTASLSELKYATGHKPGGDHTHPVNQALKAMRDAGKVEVKESDWGEPHFKLKENQQPLEPKVSVAKEQPYPDKKEDLSPGSLADRQKNLNLVHEAMSHPNLSKDDLKSVVNHQFSGLSPSQKLVLARTTKIGRSNQRTGELAHKDTVSQAVANKDSFPNLVQAQGKNVMPWAVAAYSHVKKLVEAAKAAGH